MAINNALYTPISHNGITCRDRWCNVGNASWMWTKRPLWTIILQQGLLIILLGFFFCCPNFKNAYKGCKGTYICLIQYMLDMLDIIMVQVKGKHDLCPQAISQTVIFMSLITDYDNVIFTVKWSVFMVKLIHLQNPVMRLNANKWKSYGT